MRAEASRFGFNDLVAWFDDLPRVEMATKADKDRLGASICLMIVIRWRLDARVESMVLGESRYEPFGVQAVALARAQSNIARPR